MENDTVAALHQPGESEDLLTPTRPSRMAGNIWLDTARVERVPGPHCFSFFRGDEAFVRPAGDEISVFYLTDYFFRHFEKFVREALGLDRRDDMAAFVFGNYTKLVFMPQMKDEALEQRARAIAHRLGLEYDYQFCGYGDLETSMASL